ncbi:hypothetical protein FXO38_32663 [Capsicum annuum]|uniref:S-protein homolog n=1 Tax=Capsicum annuum TaxID=4072 RepID=A0A2G2YGX8_CAPAN|nr:hypothetical protein FXO38_32663 [Capsicum annuum]KAF3620627.1 hypothetical protein FXO37_33172 [Capsicum annuum]PHT69008.1 hypothetical protein T459_28495 [Capsicum annuum]
MKTFNKCKFCILFLLILPYILIFGSCAPLQIVQVHVINRLPDGMTMTLHCQSHETDLGQSILEVGEEVDWSFRVNYWGTTLFFCDVQWDGNGFIWYHFNAYDATRDYRRCRTECWWVITQEEMLYGYNQETDSWEMLPFLNSV